MSILNWFSKPDKGLQSCYVYDTTTKKSVRARMELGRKDDNQPLIMVRENRYFGFSNEEYRSGDRIKMRVKKGRITIDGKTLSDSPTAGLNIYDFSSSDGSTPNTTPHRGNPVYKWDAKKLPDWAVELLGFAMDCLDKPKGDYHFTHTFKNDKEVIAYLEEGNIQVK